MLRTIFFQVTHSQSRQTEKEIADKIENISRKNISDISNLVKRMYLCISVEGEHFE